MESRLQLARDAGLREPAKVCDVPMLLNALPAEAGTPYLVVPLDHLAPSQRFCLANLLARDLQQVPRGSTRSLRSLPQGQAESRFREAA